MNSFKHISRILLILTICATSISAREKRYWKNDDTQKVIVYFFENRTPRADYGYYSYVIPNSISTELKKSPRYEIKIFPVKIEYVARNAPEQKKIQVMQLLSDRGSEFDADFIISGTYIVRNRKIQIKTQIFDVYKKSVTDIDESSEELGVVLLSIIDRLSKKINTELDKTLVDSKSKPKKSRYLSTYSWIDGISFGFSYGLGTMHNSWKNVYDSKIDIVTLSLSYRLSHSEWLNTIPFLKYLSVSANYDFFTTSTGYYDVDTPSYFRMNGIMGNIAGNFDLSKNFSVFLQTGYGLAQTKIEIPSLSGGSDGPPEITDINKSENFYLNISAGAIFTINHLQFNSSFSYKRIFLHDKPMDITVLYIGAGYIL